jgi:cytochrome c biogenesis protein CcmG/thiol:disulfide interchange protein DsbE
VRYEYNESGLKKIAFLLSIFLLSFGCSSCEKKEAGIKQEYPAQIGGVAPDFVLKDTGGKDVRLSGYRGKVVLLEFWATWCPPCRASVPELIKVQEEYKDRGLVVLGISVDEGENVARTLSEFSKDHKINYTVLLSNGNVEDAYKVTSIPRSFIIDKEGKIVNSYMGYVEGFKAAVSSQMEKIL